MTATRMRLALALLAASATAACGGTRLSHGDIVAALGGPGAALSAAASSSGVDGSSSAVAGSTQPAPGKTVPIPGPGGSAPAAAVAPASGVIGAAPLSAAGTGGSAVAARPVAGQPAGPLAPIVLGNIGNYSGAAGSSLAGAGPETQVWAAWVNAHGGIGGHPVQVYTADDGADPAKSFSTIRDMVENKHVIAFIGNEAILTFQAGLGYLEQHHIPVVGGDATSTTWTSSPVLFPEGTTNFELYDGLAKTVHRAGLTKVALLYCIEATQCQTNGKYVLQEGAAKNGVQVVYSSQVSITQPDYTPQCLGASSSGAQVIWAIVDSNSFKRLAASCHRQGLQVQYVAAQLVVTSDLADDPDLEGMLATVPTSPWMFGGTPAAAAYLQANQQYAPSMALSSATSISWASGQLLSRALEHLGSLPPTSDAILQGLWSLRGDTLGGLVPPLTFSAHAAAPINPCYFVVAIRGGRWTAPSGAQTQC
jgi:branched-chain amino acid transport system substrate-binding protein